MLGFSCVHDPLGSGPGSPANCPLRYYSFSIIFIQIFILFTIVSHVASTNIIMNIFPAPHIWKQYKNTFSKMYQTLHLYIVGLLENIF